jgi:Myb/SANT-like DNA-binding domain
VLLLLDQYRTHSADFRNHTLSKAEVWDRVARAMNTVKGGDDFCGKGCGKKFSNLEQRFKEKKDKVGKTGRGACRWPYFDLMSDILGNSASVQSVSGSCPPEACSSKSSAAAAPTTHLIHPPSDSSDGEEQDERAKQSVNANSQRKRKGGASNKVEVLVDRMCRGTDEWRESVDRRLSSLESIERERVGILREMKDMLGEWVKRRKED